MDTHMHQSLQREDSPPVELNLSTPSNQDQASALSGDLARLAETPSSTGKSPDVKKLSRMQSVHTRFRRWRRTRPFAAGLLTMLGGLCVLWGPLSLIRLALLPGSALAYGITVGALICLMGLLQWIAPFYSLMAGAITVILSLVSLITASFGGLGIGMLLGLIGGALGVAWKPVPPTAHIDRPSLPGNFDRPAPM